MFASTDWINPINARFMNYDQGFLELDSADFYDEVDFPNCCMGEGLNGWSFDGATFDVAPWEVLPPGSYDLYFAMGLYGYWENFAVN